MNTLKALIVTLTLAPFVMAAAQEVDKVRFGNPPPPELLEMRKRAGETRDRGRALVEQGKLDEAILAFRESIAIERETERRFGGFSSIGNYELAKALTMDSRPQEALAAYKDAFRWDPKKKELDTSGPVVRRLGVDYAILLAKSGKVEEAKAVYYWTLRALRGVDGRSEPFPFLVVFDPDPTMTVWEYTTESFVAACTMLKAPDMGDQDRTLTEKVREAEPDWIVPVMYLVASSDVRRAEYLSLAEGLAANDEERSWVRQYRELFAEGGEGWEVTRRFKGVANELAKIGVARRKASTVLAQAKLDLERNWQKVASGQSGTGAGTGGSEDTAHYKRTAFCWARIGSWPAPYLARQYRP